MVQNGAGYKIWREESSILIGTIAAENDWHSKFSSQIYTYQKRVISRYPERYRCPTYRPHNKRTLHTTEFTCIYESSKWSQHDCIFPSGKTKHNSLSYRFSNENRCFTAWFAVGPNKFFASCSERSFLPPLRLFHYFSVVYIVLTHAKKSNIT